MGSLETKPKRKYKKVIKKPEPVVEKPKKEYKALSEALKDVGLKFKKLGVDYRFGDNSTLVEDHIPDAKEFKRIADYMKKKAGSGITVTIASILNGAK
jgi:hypothetical protein|tara:strand:+ start:412 stop:705 length:294 start_codon:yes stop_codon:yes gene_type:complete